MTRLALLAIYVAGIVANIGAGPAIVRWLDARGLDAIVRLGVPAGAAVMGAVFLALLTLRWKERRPAVYAGLAAVVAIAGALAWYLRRWPAEQMHLAQYGLLGPLAVWAWWPRLDAARAVAAGLLTAAWVGLADELIQGVLASRYYDLRDVTVNAAAAVLGVAFMGLVAAARRPALTLRSPGR